jgi:hypothetical protein
LLPDCLAARFGGTLAQVEQVVRAVERGPSVEQVAGKLVSVEVSLPAAVRWVRRRLNAVRAVLVALIGLYPGRFAGCLPTICSFGERLATECVLVALRQVGSDQLAHLPSPVGFAAVTKCAHHRHTGHPHNMGPDPPPLLR